jgi:hypothetical protein
MISPSQDDSGWSKLLVAGRWSPGVVSLSGHKREAKWDVQEADGEKGATQALKGIKSGEFEGDFYLADDEDFAAWDAFQVLLESTLKPDAEGNLNGLDVIHYDLNRNGYTSIVLRTMGELRHDGKGGGWIRVKFGEHLPPTPDPPKTTSGSKSSAGKKGKGEPDPNDPITVATNELNDALAEGENL